MRRPTPVSPWSWRRHQLAPGKLLLHVGFGFASGALATAVLGTHQSRGTPMEWWQLMGDHKRVEVRNVHEVRFYRSPPFTRVITACSQRSSRVSAASRPTPLTLPRACAPCACSKR